MIKKLSAALLIAAAAIQGADAQDLLVGKSVSTLGDAKTWISNADATYTFVTDDLPKLVQDPANTSNIYLFPEAGGGWDNDANRAIGIQGFYVDMEQSNEVAFVKTTWEGAAANAYNIYLTDQDPTLDILDTTPTYSASGLGQYQENMALLPAGSKGRYLVFQPTDATNWGWGVKIRSISASAPAEDVLTSFTVLPGIVAFNEATTLTFSFKNQNNMDIDASKVTVTVSDNASLDGNQLIIIAGDKATLTATMGEVELTAEVYAATVPPVPDASSIKTPIFTNAVTDNNSTVGFVTAYNGGAVNNGLMTFPAGEVAYSFSDVRCVFFHNSETTGVWNASLDPTALGYGSLHLDIFGVKDAPGMIEFENTSGVVNHTQNFTLSAGEWTPVDIDLRGETKLANMSIRFTAENMCDILVTNMYFTAAYIEGDQTAPVLSEVTAEASFTSVKLTFSATDDLSQDVYYAITDGSNSYSVAGKSGEEVSYNVSGLNPNTEYTFVVTASDGKNISEPKEVTVTTLAFEAAPTPEVDADKVVALYSSHYGADIIPAFDSWGSSATMSTMTSTDNAEVLMFSNYLGQWGGLVNLDLDILNTNNLHIDIFSDAEGSLTVAPVWGNATGETPNKTLTLTQGQWNSFDIALEDFGWPDHGVTVIQFAMTNSTVPSFAVNNIYFYADDTQGVESVIAGAETDSVTVYSISGIILRKNVSAANALEDLPAGLYIVGGKKVIKK